MINNPWVAGIVTLAASLIWMRFNNLLAKRGIVSSSTSRKIIHIGTGPLFVLCWLLFPDKEISKYIAAFVPFLIVAQLGLVGLGVVRDDSSVKAMARSGQRLELLRGPFYYGIVFVLLTIFFWKSLYAIIPLMILCAGDGMADLIGTRFGTRKLSWNKSKSVIGSLSMFLSGFVLSIVMSLIFMNSIKFNSTGALLLFSVLGISLLSTFIESVTPSEYDNLSIPAIALIASLILL